MSDESHCAECRNPIICGALYDEDKKEWVYYCGICSACYEKEKESGHRAREFIEKLLRVGREFSPEYAWEVLVEESDSVLGNLVDGDMETVGTTKWKVPGGMD